MGEIVRTQTVTEDKIKVHIELTEQEAMLLKGSLRDIHLFAQNAKQKKARLIERGKDGAVQYLMIPPSLRPKPARLLRAVKCQILEIDTKYFFIYTCEKPDRLKIL